MRVQWLAVFRTKHPASLSRWSAPEARNVRMKYRHEDNSICIVFRSLWIFLVMLHVQPNRKS